MSRGVLLKNVPPGQKSQSKISAGPTNVHSKNKGHQVTPCSSPGEGRMIDTVSENAFADHAEGQEARYVLRPYITGNTFHTHQVLKNVKKMCEDELPGRYDLKVIDIFQRPELARAVPTLIMKHPLPRRKLIGDRSDRDGVVPSPEITRYGKAGKEGNN